MSRKSDFGLENYLNSGFGEKQTIFEMVWLTGAATPPAHTSFRGLVCPPRLSSAATEALGWSELPGAERDC